jgi:hypothetical protein
MPPDQSRHFNRLIDLMNGSVLKMGDYIRFLEQEVDKLELRQCWLVALVLWEQQRSMIRRAASLALREPITEGGYAAKQAELDAEWVAVGELAELLADDYDGWTEADMEMLEDWPEPVVSDAAWDRARAAEEKRLRKAVAAGELAGRGRGAKLEVQEGVFNAWAGRTATPVPEDLLWYRLMPDSEAAAVNQERAAVRRLQEALRWRPLLVKDSPEEENVLDVISGHLRVSIGSMFQELWSATEAVEQVLAEVAAEFDGADPLRPDKRESLDRLRARLLGLGEQLTYLDVEAEPGEPDEEMLDLLRKLVKLD